MLRIFANSKLVAFASLLAGCGGEPATTQLSEAAQRGMLIFEANCAACHKLGPEGTNIAPTLGGIVGREAGVEDFNYSPALKSATFTWTPEKIDAFLASPRESVPGNQMAFYGLEDAAERSDLISLLQHHSASD
ncbi:MAG: c-type cytochrome [Pseudomonadota bacterium]